MNTAKFMFKANIKNPLGMMGFVPGNGGEETPLRTKSGQWVLWVFNTISAEHTYVDINGERIEPDFHSIPA